MGLLMKAVGISAIEYLKEMLVASDFISKNFSDQTTNKVVKALINATGLYLQVRVAIKGREKSGAAKAVEDAF